MNQFLKKLDRFSISPRFYIKKNDYFHTIYGGCTTIIVFGLIIAFGFNFSQNFIFKMNPNIITSQKGFEEIPKFYLSNLKTGFFFHSPPTGKIIDPTIYQVSAGIFTSKLSLEGNQSVESKPLKMENCTFDRFKSKKDNPVIRRLRVDLNICFSEEMEKDISIEGGWGQSLYELVYVDFIMCVNNTENGNSCKPQEHIDRILMNAAVGVDILDSLIDLNDFHNPIKQQIFTSFTSISSKVSKDIYIFIKSGVINTDKGWLLNEYEENFYLKLDRELLYDKDINETDNNKRIARIYFRMSNLFEIYERKYDKLQDVAAKLGAISNLLIRLFGILLFPLISFEYKKNLSNKFFYFETKEWIQLSNNEKNQKNAKNNGEGLYEKLKKSRKLHFNFFEKVKLLIFNFLGKKSQKLDYLNTAYDKIINRLDVYFILNKLYELEKLKLIMLSENQNRLIKYLPKPLISEKSIRNRDSYKLDKTINFFTIWDELFEKKCEKPHRRKKAKEAFMNTIKKQRLSEIDIKIISFLKDATVIGPSSISIDEHDPFSRIDDVVEENHVSKIQDLVSEKRAFQIANKGNE